jgi:hypothetical protein
MPEVGLSHSAISTPAKKEPRRAITAARRGKFFHRRALKDHSAGEFIDQNAGNRGGIAHAQRPATFLYNI